MILLINFDILLQTFFTCIRAMYEYVKIERDFYLHKKEIILKCQIYILYMVYTIRKGMQNLLNRVYLSLNSIIAFELCNWSAIVEMNFPEKLNLMGYGCLFFGLFIFLLNMTSINHFKRKLILYTFKVHRNSIKRQFIDAENSATMTIIHHRDTLTNYEDDNLLTASNDRRR